MISESRKNSLQYVKDNVKSTDPIFKFITSVSFFTLISRLLGLLREVLMSHYLGATLVSDAFLIAFKFPNFFRRFFAEGAFHAAFVPEFTSLLKDPSQAKKLFCDVKIMMGVVLCILVMLVELLTPFFMSIIAPGASDELKKLASSLTKITFPYILLISLSAILSGVLNSLNRFAAAAAAPIILNIFMIGALLISPDPYTLSVSVILAGIGQWAFLMVLSNRQGYALKWQKLSITPPLKNILKRMGPGMISAGISQINMLIDLTFASFLSVGSLSYIYYADRLNQLPLSIFGIAIATVILPFLSKAVSSSDRRSIERIQTNSLCFTLRLSLPSAIGLVLLSHDIIELVYGHGRFTNDAVTHTANALAVLGVGLPAYIILKVFNNCFFSRKDTKTPMGLSVICIGIHIMCNFLFIEKFGHVALCAATTLAAWCQVIFTFIILKKRQWFMFTSYVLWDILWTLLACVCMCWVIIYLSDSHIMIKIPISILVYFLTHINIIKKIIPR
jgi:putative peptidoglycan lipid II flippase